MAYRGNKTGKFSEISHLVNGPGDEEDSTENTSTEQEKKDAVLAAFKKHRMDKSNDPTSLQVGSMLVNKNKEGVWQSTEPYVNPITKEVSEITRNYDQFTDEEKKLMAMSRADYDEQQFYEGDEFKKFANETAGSGVKFDASTGQFNYDQRIQKK
tara:strand:- start:201 stop:665 length:465 start_codon:yes stop_codon:yes gene_type:complete